MNNKTLDFFFTDIFQNPEAIRPLLSEEKFNILQKSLSFENFIEPRLEGGQIIKDWLVHKDTGFMFHKRSFERWSLYYHEDCSKIWLHYLTEEEIDILNKKGDELHRNLIDKNRFDKAEKIAHTEYFDWVYCNYLDEYFPSVECCIEAYEDKEQRETEFERPEFVYACRKINFLQLPMAADLLYNYCQDEAPEDWEPEEAEGLKELDKAIDEFNKKNENQVSYWPDYKKVVLIPKNLDF